MSEPVDNEQIAQLLDRPYKKVIRGEPVEGYLAEAPELPGCITAGATESEALTNLREAMTVWFEWALAGGHAIPAPEVWITAEPHR